jgi:hypothetical protein
VQSVGLFYPIKQCTVWTLSHYLLTSCFADRAYQYNFFYFKPRVTQDTWHIITPQSRDQQVILHCPNTKNKITNCRRRPANISLMKPTWFTFHSVYWESRSNVTVTANSHYTHAIYQNAVCAASPEVEQIVLETCRGSWFSINVGFIIMVT